MHKSRIYTAIGLMSGTSLDGIDAALIRTDGIDEAAPVDFISIPYDEELRGKLRACLGREEDFDGAVVRAETDMTRVHAAAVDWLLSKAGLAPKDIDLIGFHGQTIFHAPERHLTWQIGNGAMLARLTGIDVVNDFRSADVISGGEGAPFLPLYHRARAAASGLDRPVAILNIGGVGNMTYLGAGVDDILAFDTGPGNALLDDWVQKHFDRSCDENGLMARQGQVRQDVLDVWLSHDYFDRGAPKSLDRNAWDVSALQTKSVNSMDGAATLTEFTVQAIAKAREHMPEAPKAWYVTGGGRHNDFMMERLRAVLGGSVMPVEEPGWNGDALEAEGFAYLAVRSVLGLPLSLPLTTGVPAPQTGGRLSKAV